LKIFGQCTTFAETAVEDQKCTYLGTREVRKPQSSKSLVDAMNANFGVARLGEFSQFGQLFTLGQLFKEVYEMVWATFWAIFSQTHLVTLPKNLKFLGYSFPQKDLF
jgi:hypothetical protein